MSVNFVYQVRSFHRFKREAALSANAQALWLELFGLFNERRFPDELPVSTTHLSAILGVGKDTVLRGPERTCRGRIAGIGGRAARAAIPGIPHDLL